MLTRARNWCSHHVLALTAAGEWAAGLGLAVATAFQLGSSPVSVTEAATDTPAPEAASFADDSTTTPETNAAEPAAVFLPEDTIVAHSDATNTCGAGAAQMQKPSG
jgi:hypothetical protein